MRKFIGISVLDGLSALLAALAILFSFPSRPVMALTEPVAGKVAREASYGSLPLLFIPNQGQYDRRVAYAVQGRDKSIFFSNEGLAFVLSGPVDSPPAGKPRTVRDLAPHEPGPPMPQQRWTIKLDFVDANPEARPESLEQAGTVISYFKGQPEEWRTGLQASGKIIYRDLWPGIDLIYSGTVHRLKYDFIVHPGADPARIRLSCRGADGVAVTPSGEMELTTPLGTLRDEMPKAWQERDDGRQEDVAVAYALKGPAGGVEVAALAPDQSGAATPARLDSSQKQQVYGFTVGDYDRTRTLVLDPEMLVYCGFLGGSGNDYGQGIAVDSSGSAYVTGYTFSTQATFPETVGPDLSHNGGSYDVFVAKVRADGTGLIYCGYIGGSGQEIGQGIAVDSSGSAYVTGWTNSTEASFPEITGPLLIYSGGNDVFVARLDATGTDLLYCGYLGGINDDVGQAIAVDSGGNAYITGYTEGGFLVGVGPYLTYNGGASDAFVAKINAGGGGLYSGYIGGSNLDYGTGIAVDSSGNAYVTGYTNSASDDGFPVRVGPSLLHQGNYDVFVAKVNSAGSPPLVYGGYIGGSANDYGQGIAVDSSGNAYVTGSTSSSPYTGFPVTVGPGLTHNIGADAFAAKIKADGTGLTYCGYIGGAGTDYGRGVAVDSGGNAYITGETTSTQTSFPVSLGPDLTHNGGFDVFVAKVQTNGSGLASCGYLGGTEDDYGRGIAVDSNGNAYVVGYTTSTQTTFPVTVGPDLSHNGSSDAFIAKLTEPFPWEIFLPAILKGARKEAP